MRTLAEVIEENAARSPDGTAFLAGAHRLSWSEYATRSDALAGLLLDLGLAKGDRVAVLLPDGPAVHVAFVATEKAGLVAVGIGARSGRREIEHLLDLTGARALVSPPMHGGLDLAELVAERRASGAPLRHHVAVVGELEPADDLTVDGAPVSLSSVDPALRTRLAGRRLGATDLWLLNSTSGTTGLPKCVMHDQARWLFFHELARRAADLVRDDVFLSAVPAPFGFGLWTAHFTPTLLGAPTVLVPRFQPEEALAALERHAVTVLAAVSTQFRMLLDAPGPERRSGPLAAFEGLGGRDLRALRVLFTGGEKVSYARALEFEERTGAAVLQFYGSNETGALAGTTLRDPREKRLGTAGRPIPEMQVRLFDASGRDTTAQGRGQPGAKGGTLSLGYFADEEANRELIRDDGWFLVGDEVRIDAEGYLVVEGRASDFIIRGGKNVSARAVEEAVETHPAVLGAAAVAVADPTFGERVCAYVELRAGQALALEELAAHLAATGYSKEIFPERLVVLSELPRSVGGKIAKQALREDAARRFA